MQSKTEDPADLSFQNKANTGWLSVPWWHEHDVFRAWKTHTLDLKVTDGQSTQYKGGQQKRIWRKRERERGRGGWGGATWDCLHCWKKRKLRKKKLISWMCWCERCHVSPAVKPIIFMSKSFEWLNAFLLWDKTLDPLSHRLFLYFLNSFSFIQPPFLISAKHTPATFLLRTDSTLLCVQRFSPLLQRESFAVCHTFLLMLIHMVIGYSA